MTRLLRIALLALLLAGCTGYASVQEKNRQLLRGGEYQAALTTLEKSSLATSNNNKLLYLLEKGHLQHLGGNYSASNETLHRAEYLAEELFTKSLSRGAASFLSNDNVIPYSGEDYESALIHYYKALNYIALGNLEDAGVESRKVDEKLNYFFDSYDGKNVYKEDAFIRLLTGLIYEAQGDVNNAFIAYRKSLEAYRYFEKKYRVSVPALLWQRLVSTARALAFTEEFNQYTKEALAAGVEPLTGSAYLIVIADLGTIPAKREVSLIFPTEKGFPVKLALPAFDRDNATPQLRVQVDGQNYPAATVDNIAAIARQSLEDKKGRILTKMIARAVAKELAVRVMEKEHGGAAGLLARVTSLASEQADTRLWSTLPQSISAALVPLETGTHQVTVTAGACVINRTVDIKRSPIEFLFLRGF